MLTWERNTENRNDLWTRSLGVLKECLQNATVMPELLTCKLCMCERTGLNACPGFTACTSTCLACDQAVKRNTSCWPVTAAHMRGHDGHVQPVPKAAGALALAPQGWRRIEHTHTHTQTCGKNRQPVSLRNSQNPTCPSAFPRVSCVVVNGTENT